MKRRRLVNTIKSSRYYLSEYDFKLFAINIVRILIVYLYCMLGIYITQYSKILVRTTTHKK